MRNRNSVEKRISEGVHPTPELSVTADTADILAVADGKLDPTQALMQGKAQVKGNPSEAIEVAKVFIPG